jgi:hypothetical protein
LTGLVTTGKKPGLRAGREWVSASRHNHLVIKDYSMGEPHVTLDPDDLSPVEAKLRGPLEEQLTSALQAATDKVTHAYAGEPVEQVTDELLSQTKAGLHPDIAAGFAPDQGELRRVAEEIVHRG